MPSPVHAVVAWQYFFVPSAAVAQWVVGLDPWQAGTLQEPQVKSVVWAKTGSRALGASGQAGDSEAKIAAALASMSAGMAATRFPINIKAANPIKAIFFIRNLLELVQERVRRYAAPTPFFSLGVTAVSEGTRSTDEV
jgi:hypothetical protein